MRDGIGGVAASSRDSRINKSIRSPKIGRSPAPWETLLAVPAVQRVVRPLMAQERLSVVDLTVFSRMSHSAVNYRLRQLERAGMVEKTLESGRWQFVLRDPLRVSRMLQAPSSH